MSKTRRNSSDYYDIEQLEQKKQRADIKRFEDRRKAKKRANAVRSRDWRTLTELEDD